MIGWIAIPVGVALIFLAIRDILLTLMTASGRGPISRRLMALAWLAMRPVVRRSRAYREIVGPLTFIGVIGSWAVMIILGWALIYWPFLPDRFLVDFGLALERGNPGSFVMSLYLSMVVLSTLGFGDIVPTGVWLRLLTPLEALIGFGLITASISWFLSILPAISRRRRFAHQIALVREAEEQSGQEWTAEAAIGLLDSFSTQLIDIRSDQIQFPVIYYFRDADPAAELAPNLRYLLEMATWAQDTFGEPGSSIYLHQHMLRRAVNDYLETVASQFFKTKSVDIDRLLDALADDRV